MLVLIIGIILIYTANFVLYCTEYNIKNLEFFAISISMSILVMCLYFYGAREGEINQLKRTPNYKMTILYDTSKAPLDTIYSLIK